MSNSIDFRADQIQTKQIIVKNTSPDQSRLLIYGIEAEGSPVNEGVINTTHFPQNGIGTDVFLFVSGAVNTKGSATERGTSVFGGDVVVSGAFYQGQPSAVKGGNYSHAEGYGSQADGNHSHTEGQYTLTTNTGIYAHAEGYLTTASAYAAHSEGDTTKAQTNGSHAEGHNSYTFDLGSVDKHGYYAHAEGDGTSVCGNGAHAEGYYSAASGAYSHAEGFNAISKGSHSHAEGQSSIASGSYSHAEGQSSLASGSCSHAEGHNTTAEADSSHAEGAGTTSKGLYSHAEGESTTAQGQSSHTEGYLTYTFNNHAEGQEGYNAHAEGEGSSACGDGSHAEGYYTAASGAYSHAEGYQTIAFGTGSHASGYGTVASGAVDGTALSATSIVQTATGRFNKTANTTSLFVVGNGTGDLNRKDLFSVDSINQEGMIKINGGISYGVGYYTYKSPSDIQGTLTLNDYLVIVNVTAGGPFRVDLPPSAATPIGTTYVIRRIDGGLSPYNNFVTIFCQNGDYILDNSGNYLNYTGYLEITGNTTVKGGGCVTVTYIGNYKDASYGTNPTWITTNEIYL